MPSATFPTAIGDCTLSWDTAGLTGFTFPAAPRFESSPTSAAKTSAVAPLARAAIPPAIAALITRVQRHLAGDLQDFGDLTFDWSRVTAFQSRVLRALLRVGPGRTATYGELARATGAKPGAARAIGGAVGANPWPLLVPCHRILGAGGKLTGFSAPGGVRTKAKLLALEGVVLPGT